MSSIASPRKAVPFEALAGAAYLAAAALALALSRGWLALSALETVKLCLFRSWTGLPCPGCGMGHAVLEAFQGHWAASFADHPLGPPLVAAWTLWLAWGAANLARRRAFAAGMPALRAPAGAALVGGVLLAHAARVLHAL